VERKPVNADPFATRRRRGGARLMKLRKAQLPAYPRTGWLEKLDGRSLIARAAHERIVELSEHLGGADLVTSVERSLLDRLVHAELIAQRYEAQLRSGALDDPGPFFGAMDRILRYAQALGLRRRARDLVPEIAHLIVPLPADRAVPAKEPDPR
jgi:hypothetical protein